VPLVEHEVPQLDADCGQLTRVRIGTALVGANRIAEMQPVEVEL
jgi:hypothetical protein